MSDKQRLTYHVLSALLFVSAFVFFAFFYRGHLYYNEQYQLFQFTSSYFLGLLKYPGGVAAWCSRFLIQFFLFPVAGGMIYACAIKGVQFLCSRIAVQRTFLSDMASFIPAVVLWIAMCREYVQINLAVCALICLAGASICLKSKASAVLFIVLTPVLYWICGFAAVIFAFASLCTRKWWVCPASLAILIALPFLIRPFVRFDITSLFKGYFYLKDPKLTFTWPWICFGSAAVYVALFSFRIRENAVAAFCVAGFAVVGGVFGILKAADFRWDEEMVYSNLVRQEKWEKIIQKAKHNPPMNKFCVADLNLALAMQGRLGEDMFKFVQSGTECLIPPYEKLHDDNLICSDVFYYLALTSASQRHMFECKEAIPSLEKGSRMYQRLAQTNSINNNFAASHKYLDALSKTLFYRRWAGDFSDWSDDLNRMRALRPHGDDYFFTHENILDELGSLYQENPDNDMAFQYAAAYALLKKDLDAFKAVTSMRSFVNVPRSYQEAFLLVWVRNHSDLNGLPGFISATISKRFVRFVEANNNGMDIQKIKKKFGDTYWFYYYCNNAGK